MKKRKVKVVIYIRYSSHNQEGSFSVEYQLAECTKYLESCGYELVEVYIDEAKTGKKVAGRDAFDSMMYDASLNKFEKIIVFSFSRSFRNTRDALNYNYELREKYGIVIESVIERIDMSDPHGKFSGTNLFAMHELQSDITAAHVKSGMYFAAQQGYYLGGFVPFGYEIYGTGEFSRGRERKKYRPHEEEKEIVKEMFELYADGLSLNSVVRVLGGRGVKGRKGDLMNRVTVRRILNNPFYVGTRIYKVKGYETLEIENSVPAIVDAETWNKVQIIHQDNMEKTVTGRRTERIYGLTGKITCAKCGAHMYGTYKGKTNRATNANPYAYYICANKKQRMNCDAGLVRKDYLENYVVEQIKKHILNEEAMRDISQQIASEAGNSFDEMSVEKEKAEKRKVKITGILKQIKKDVYEGELAKDIGDEMTAEYEAELLKLENNLSNLTRAISSAITPEGVYSYLQNLLSLAGDKNDEIRKMLFDKLVDKIIIHDDRIELHLIVFPFAHIRDKSTQAPPHVRLSLKVSKEAIKR